MLQHHTCLIADTELLRTLLPRPCTITMSSSKLKSPSQLTLTLTLTLGPPSMTLFERSRLEHKEELLIVLPDMVSPVLRGVRYDRPEWPLPAPGGRLAPGRRAAEVPLPGSYSWCQCLMHGISCAGADPAGEPGWSTDR